MRAGLYDLNSEFYVTEASALFMHSTYGIGTDIAQSGENGPSIFPNTALGVRIKVAPTPHSYAQFVILDGVAGDPTNQKGSQIDLDKADGTLWVGEAGVTPRDDTKLAVGVWHYSQEAANPYSQGELLNNGGFYVIGQTKIWTAAGSETQGVTLFGRIGIADKRLNQFDTAWSVGVVYDGIFKTRDDGQFGIGLSSARTSTKLLTALQGTDILLDKSETALEVTYRDTLGEWLTVQPNFQYIVNPSTDPTVKNAVVIGVRTVLAF